MFAWNKFEVLKKSPELAKLHLATVWESVPAILSQNKGLYTSHCTARGYIAIPMVGLYRTCHIVCLVFPHFTQTNN